MRDPTLPFQGPTRNAGLIRQELEAHAAEVYDCYENGMSAREALAQIQAAHGIAPGGFDEPRFEQESLDALREVLALAAGFRRKGEELESFFNLFDPTRNSQQYRISLFDTVFRDKLEHLLTWQPSYCRESLEKLIGRPLRERQEYPVVVQPGSPRGNP